MIRRLIKNKCQKQRSRRCDTHVQFLLALRRCLVIRSSGEQWFLRHAKMTQQNWDREGHRITAYRAGNGFHQAELPSLVTRRTIQAVKVSSAWSRTMKYRQSQLVHFPVAPVKVRDAGSSTAVIQLRRSDSALVVAKSWVFRSCTSDSSFDYPAQGFCNSASTAAISGPKFVSTSPDREQQGTRLTDARSLAIANTAGSAALHQTVITGFFKAAWRTNLHDETKRVCGLYGSTATKPT